MLGVQCTHHLHPLPSDISNSLNFIDYLIFLCKLFDYFLKGSVGGVGGGGGGGGANNSGNSAVGGSMGGGENLSCAVDHVIRWATTVMTAVEKIQWRPLGSYSIRKGIMQIY